MENKVLKVAIISDLHCHPERKSYSENNTLLFSDKLRSPTHEHPVENLLEIIESESLQVDLVLSPGDFTHQSDKQGFFSGWSYVSEISRALKSKEIIATIGNHDIDSRHQYSQYSFDIPKKIKQNFPLKKEHLGSFWELGFTFIEEQDFQILVINSTHFHTHNESQSMDNPVVKGKVELGQIEEIEKYLKTHNDDNKIKIALCHHHPLQHKRLELGEHDFIENGEDLLQILGKYKYDLIIHGHKHDPWLRYYNTGAFSIPILSSGSFSATNQISWINKFNYFHIVEFEKKSKTASTGKVETWTFKSKVGWKKDKDDGFYPYTGFGYLDNMQQLLAKIKKLLEQKDMWLWKDLLIQIPEIENLTPEKMEELQDELEKEKIFINTKIGLRPKHIYYERC
ncbi:metallophosphoesterase [Chitinophaga ginsengisegetis]|uniref:metallophosphoesterase family protein n=1 Tax=Chitinophaga ginsengisegetis TaxID=393003 RepID=UPI003444DFA7